MEEDAYSVPECDHRHLQFTESSFSCEWGYIAQLTAVSFSPAVKLNTFAELPIRAAVNYKSTEDGAKGTLKLQLRFAVQRCWKMNSQTTTKQETALRNPPILGGNVRMQRVWAADPTWKQSRSVGSDNRLLCPSLTNSERSRTDAVPGNLTSGAAADVTQGRDHSDQWPLKFYPTQVNRSAPSLVSSLSIAWVPCWTSHKKAWRWISVTFFYFFFFSGEGKSKHTDVTSITMAINK